MSSTFGEVLPRSAWSDIVTDTTCQVLGLTPHASAPWLGTRATLRKRVTGLLRTSVSLVAAHPALELLLRDASKAAIQTSVYPQSSDVKEMPLQELADAITLLYMYEKLVCYHILDETRMYTAITVEQAQNVIVRLLESETMENLRQSLQLAMILVLVLSTQKKSTAV